MPKPEKRNLEELVNNTQARVLILDDDPKDVELITRALNKKGKPDRLRVEGTTSIDEALRLLTQNNRYWVLVSDINLGVTDGSDFVKKIKDIRGDTLDAILMSGVVVGDFHITSLAKNLSYVAAVWEKDLSKVNLIYDTILDIVSRRQLAFPKFPRVYILAGGRGAGKDSNTGSLKQMPHVYVTAPPTTRKPGRPSDIPDLSIPARYRRVEREFLTSEEMRERITDAENPLIWTDEGPVLTKHAYLKSALTNQNFYMLDLGMLEKKLDEGDVVLPIRNINALEALKRFFAERCHVILLDAGQFTRRERIVYEGRPVSEVKKIGEERNEKQQLQYLLKSDTVIKTHLGFPYDYATGEAQFRMDAIDHTRGRISEEIKRLRETPYNVSASEMHAEYVRKVKSVLCELAGSNELNVGSKITIPWEVKEEFQSANLGEGDNFLNLIPRISSARVDEIVDEGGVTVVSLRPFELYGTSKAVRTGRPWDDVLEGLIGCCLKQKGFCPSQTSNIFPDELFLYPQQVEHRLVYAETDAPPNLAKGEQAKHYRLELVFG